MTPSSKASKGSSPSDQFIALCKQADAPPNLAAFLKTLSGCTLREKLDVITVDQYWRWMLGKGIAAEKYLKRFPDIAGERQLKFELIVGEFCDRRDAGEKVDPAEFASRFPDLAKVFLRSIADADQLRRFRRHSAAGAAERSRSETATIATTESQLTDVTPSTSVDEPTGAIRDTFERYRIIRQLGEGTLGTVYLAEDPQLNRRVALRIPKFAHGNRDEAIAHFYKEARIAAGLRNANICPVYDVGEVEGVHFISMPYIEGRLLSDVAAKGKRIKVREVVLFVRTLAMALHEAHLQKIVHRGLKPSNIIVDERGQPIIMDFGLARQTYEPQSERSTDHRTLVGSPAYMSPELIKSDEMVGPQSDMFSLGVLMYELLTGRHPFQGSVAKMAQQIVSQEPVKPTKIRPDLDASLERVCLRMLAKQPEKRYSSMSKVAVELTKYLRRPGQDSKVQAAASQGGSSATMKVAPPPEGQSKSKAKVRKRRPAKAKKVRPDTEQTSNDGIDDWLKSDGELFSNVDISELLDDR